MNNKGIGIMKNLVKSLTVGAILGLASISANAAVITFDTGYTEQNATSIDFGDFIVTGGASVNFNLAPTVTQVFDLSQITSATVNLDINPANGGLGVKSGLSGDSDNFEGSFSNNTNYDEVLFFSFDFVVNLGQIFLNAGAGNGHQDLFDNASDVFGIFISADGVNDFTSVTAGNIGYVSNEIMDTAGLSLTGQYFAIAHVGPTSSVGGYIESIEYTAVSEPSIIALMGLGFIGLRFLNRRKNKA